MSYIAIDIEIHLQGIQMTHSMENSSNSLTPADNSAFHQISSRFSEPLDCLAAHLLYECSEVLAGIKPANLVSLVNRDRTCGRNLYQLWQTHRVELTQRITNLKFRVLLSKDRSLLLFCYNPEQLQKHISHSGIRKILAISGYDVCKDNDALLDELCRRTEKSGGFPHEVGLFIGYPTKDVAAFMGIVKLPFACQGPWKIFGEPGQSLQLANAFRISRQQMGRQLAGCNSPFECLETTLTTNSFFLQAE